MLCARSWTLLDILAMLCKQGVTAAGYGETAVRANADTQAAGRGCGHGRFARPVDLPAAPAFSSEIGIQPRCCALGQTEDFRGDITVWAHDGFHHSPFDLPEPQHLSIRLIDSPHHSVASPGALNGEPDPALLRKQHDCPGLVVAMITDPAEDRVTGPGVHDLCVRSIVPEHLPAVADSQCFAAASHENLAVAAKDRARPARYPLQVRPW